LQQSAGGPVQRREHGNGLRRILHGWAGVGEALAGLARVSHADQRTGALLAAEHGAAGPRAEVCDSGQQGDVQLRPATVAKGARALVDGG